MINLPRIAAIITAAGSSVRMGGLKKEYRLLPGRFDSNGNPLTVLGAAAAAFASVEEICAIVIAVPPGGEQAARAVLPAFPAEYIRCIPGGPTRRASVHNALAALKAADPAYVLIHDGARPWVDEALIRRAIAAVIAHNAVVPLLPLTETPKEIDGAGFVRRHLKRAQIGGAQTPQAFAYPAILLAHEQAAVREREEGVSYTDDAEVWGEFAGPVAVIEGSPQNRKITFPEDMAAF
ncbi:MAG: 2-C-methyl-D-erythritol 4-phosphate cytidylyltransferase [Spirochaetaceae bacterium]|jgi:2-C-methyl-D-erythritol 4-phosphate cytidylyltransferase|nr:2-C-methyl-D-erythritol 4-phosphate cytidylyltransferase [Spirochaetaceae bacterium]